MRTQEPSFRITRSITFRGKKFPIAAECSACADAQFILKTDKRQNHPELDLEPNLGRLKGLFDAHLKLAHSTGLKTETRSR